jgi:hypothetical protein
MKLWCGVNVSLGKIVMIVEPDLHSLLSEPESLLDGDLFAVVLAENILVEGEIYSGLS